ncbi:MAG: hypothetical protein IPP34_02460 [Bacteroidetes bacterium]|nr:hypothetical protein [Bacteroidota bacterium]
MLLVSDMDTHVPRESIEDVPVTGIPLLKSNEAESPKHQMLLRFCAFTNPQAMMLKAITKKEV